MQPITSVSQFYSFCESRHLCCVYFTAPWCFRCKALASKIEHFPRDYAGAVDFTQVDLEETEELGELLDIHTLPTFSLVKGGVEVHRVEGVPQQRPARALSLALRKHLLGEAVGDQ